MQFDPMYPYIDSDLGGYGLYCGATMAATGLLIPALPQVGVPFDAPTPVGQRAAAAFREAIAGTAYYRGYIAHPDRPVPEGVVLEYARAPACASCRQTASRIGRCFATCSATEVTRKRLPSAALACDSSSTCSP